MHNGKVLSIEDGKHNATVKNKQINLNDFEIPSWNFQRSNKTIVTGLKFRNRSLKISEYFSRNTSHAYFTLVSVTDSGHAQ